MVKRFISFGLALLICCSVFFMFPKEKVSAEDSDFESIYYSLTDFSYFDRSLYDSSFQFISNYSKPNLYSSDYIPLYAQSFSSNFTITYFKLSDFDITSFEVDKPNSFIYFLDSSGNRVTNLTNGICFNFRPSGNSDAGVLSYDENFSISDFRISLSSPFVYRTSYYFIPYSLNDYFSSLQSSLSFSLSPELSLDMDLDSVQNSLTVSVDNPTEKAYDYMLYVSSTPAATSLTSSLYNMNFASSSKQWCYTKQSDSSVPPDLQQLIKDNASDTFTTSTIIDTLYPGSTGVLFNVWGSQFKAYSEYLSYKEDHITFYSLSQTNCPIYLINREDSRSHVIPFSSFNIEMGKTYYFNIIYREHDQTVVGALGTSTTALLAAGNGQYSYPVFDTSQFTSYQNYSSTEFSVTNGILSNPQKDDLTDFHSVAYYSNPDHSTAYITNDNSVNINNSFNSGSGSGSGDGGYDPSCSTNYINHGVIYHGCTIYNSPSGSGSGSGSSGSVPDLPEFDFTELYEKSGGFFDFVKLVIENSGWIPVTIFSSLCLVVLFCRIWGR